MQNDKSLVLLNFLRETATLRRKRISSYGPTDKVLWFADIPRDCTECRSPFLSEKSANLGDLWLEIIKKRMPARPPEPSIVKDWVRVDELNNPKNEPKLLPEITVIVERQVPDPDAPQGTHRTIVQKVPENRRLEDNPNVQKAWAEYLDDKWKPWAQEMRRWEEVQYVYESLDFMRRRIEEAEERYELVLAIGFLQWRDPTGTVVARHVLSAPADLTLDAARGLLTVAPPASFNGFRVELDMLELQHRPRLNEKTLGDLLEKLDIHVWDVTLVAPLLHEIANSLSADAQVHCETFDRADCAEERPHPSYAPALVLRERRPTAYDDLIRKFLEFATENELTGTLPWHRLLQEGEPPGAGWDSPIAVLEENRPRPAEVERILFPLPTNEEQLQIIHRLETEPCVLVKGPPGTGKSHTIANLICHLLAKGDRVLVTAHAPKALEVLRGLLPVDIRDLCVTAMGSSREDQRLLEESVRGILSRRNEWKGPEAAQRAIEEAESTLLKLEGELARVERDLRAFREAETYSHQLPGGYTGTAAQIARMLSEQEQEFDWFPELSADAAFPLEPAESAFLTEAHPCFTADARAELQIEVGTADLPSPDKFQELVERLTAAERSAQRASLGVDKAKLEFLEPSGTEQLRRLRQAIQAFSDRALRASRVFGKISETILLDLLASAEARWTRHADDSEAMLADVRQRLKAFGSARVDLPDGIVQDHLRRDVERRLAHFEAGGWKGFSFFAPRVVRETRYIV